MALDFFDWRAAIGHYHKQTNVALDPSLDTTIPILLAAGYKIIDPLPDPVYVSDFITMGQCRAYLITHNLFSAVDAAIKQMPPLAQSDWEYRTTVLRSNPLVVQMQAMFGWTSEQMGQMFIDASKL